MRYLFIFLYFILSVSTSSASTHQKFHEWKIKFIQRAIKNGLPKTFLNKEMRDISFAKNVIENDRNQITANVEVDYEVWIKKWLRENPSRIDLANEMLSKHKNLLAEVEKKYLVDREVIVSLWGVETFFGQITGDYDLLDSLASLSFDGRRRKFFENQLISALKLIHQGHVTRDKLKGSWAGATGQCQFMPSNISAYAQDMDGDGKKDIWSNEADIFASIANLLNKSGWKKGHQIGDLVKSPTVINFKMNWYRTAEEYNNLGFRGLNGEKISGKWKRMATDIPFKNSPIILRGSNYKAIMRWNRSSLFAAFNIIMVQGMRNH